MGDGSITIGWGVGTFINTNLDIISDISELVQKYDCCLKPKNSKTYYVVKNNNVPKGSYRNSLRTILDSVNLKRGNSYNKIIPSVFFNAENNCTDTVVIAANAFCTVNNVFFCSFGVSLSALVNKICNGISR